MRGNRSGCPINLTMEIIGDRWSLIVLRDIMFGNRRHFRNLLENSMESIASNVLAARLKRLVEVGLLSRSDDASHKQKVLYSLTEPAIQLVPVMATIGTWGSRHLRPTWELSVRAQLLEEGGPDLWDDFMEDLRTVHLGAPPRGGISVQQRLTEAYETAVRTAEDTVPSIGEATSGNAL